MTADPRAALDRFVAALEAHYHAVSTRRGDDDPAVDDAYEVLADAFEVYEDALAQVYSEVTPFFLDDGDDDDDSDDDDDDEDDDEDEDDDLDAELDTDLEGGAPAGRPVDEPGQAYQRSG
ncbi:MAG TPA: primosomal protein [Luteimicrobium sp.]|uniref:primosomal protein n=1 Tax=Isoptericola variabilis TaxID=139208 RepID=UPI002C7B1EE2|nr:primosomal protein [Luteimicrobium sp.]